MSIMNKDATLRDQHRQRQEARLRPPLPERGFAEVALEAPVRTLLRWEGAAAFAAGLAAFGWLGEPWWLFLALILLPDLGMIGYLRDSRTGAFLYNATHTYVAPLLLAVLGLVGLPFLLPAAATWVAHIGLDRALGFGLKYREGFRLTHLGILGR